MEYIEGSHKSRESFTPLPVHCLNPVEGNSGRDSPQGEGRHGFNIRRVKPSVPEKVPILNLYPKTFTTFPEGLTLEHQGQGCGIQRPNNSGWRSWSALEGEWGNVHIEGTEKGEFREFSIKQNVFSWLKLLHFCEYFRYSSFKNVV